MCGRFTLTAPASVVQDLFEVQRLPGLDARYNIAPTQDVLAIRDDEDGAREALLMRWGLIPHWAEDKSIGSRLINARAETAADKPAFRHSFENRRCLIAADGFIEWKRQGKQKQPFWMQLADGGPFGFAGLWTRWRDEEADAWLQSCTILTTSPNELVAPVHNRMPVIVAPKDHATWLSSETSLDALDGLLGPFPAEQMKSTAVSTRVNSVANDDEACLQPTQTQGQLL